MFRVSIRMSFSQLKVATAFVNDKTKYFERIDDWEMKRDALLVQIADFPTLIDSYKSRCQAPYPENPKITLTDEAPRIRLQNACEATSNTLYGMSEIAASVANKVSNGKLGSKFTSIRKLVNDGQADPKLAEALKELHWYEKVRELRTEWAHHSTAYISQPEDEIFLVVRCFRRKSDKVHIKDDFHFPVREFPEWASNAIKTIDAFAGYLLSEYVLPLFPREYPCYFGKRDANGCFLFTPDGRIEVEHSTYGEYFARFGIVYT
jgi:hypothetical protein